MKTKGIQRILALLLSSAMLSATIAPASAYTPDDSKVITTSTQFANGYSEDPNRYEIYPVPHSVEYPAGSSAFTMTNEVNLVAENGIDQYTIAFLKDILAKYGMTASISQSKSASKTNIMLGIHGTADTTVADPVPSAYPDLFGATKDTEKFDPYMLTVETSSNPHGDITIVGRDSDCVYYGLATLQMMFTSFAGKKFLPVQIEDYSNVRFRGFIEGFYGGFDYAGRETQMRSIRDVKGNIYVFASKTDPYHSNDWDKLYPAEELSKIAHLVQVGLETKVDYAWSVHIGKGKFFENASADPNAGAKYQKYQENLQKLKAKFDQLYNVGVRNFHILNDDYNSGTNADVVALVNEINRWLKSKKDCGPIIYCPKGYNISWAGNGNELKELSGLDDDVYIYWTGADVNSPIKQDNISWPYEKSKQYPVTWLNYPCSEHDKGGIYLGDISHYVSEADGLTGQMGIISNPVNYPEANKVAYFQLISWGWNRDNYTSYMTELWEDSFKYLQPEVYDAYLTIARNVSNCPGSGRIPQGFPESEYLADRLDSLQKKALSGNLTSNDPELQSLMAEYTHILNAVNEFRSKCTNKALVAELEPWLKSLTGIVTAGQQALLASLALRTGDVNAAWTYLSNASLDLDEWDNYATPQYANKIAQAGSKRLQPFADSLITAVRNELLPILNPDGMGGDPSFYSVIGGKRQDSDANSDKMFDGDPSTFAHFKVNQQKNDYIGVDLGAVKTVRSIDILQGEHDTHHDYMHQATLECSLDGENWITLVDKVNSTHIKVDALDVSTRYVRMRLLETGYQNKPSFWTCVREFTVETDTTDSGPVYTNLESSANLSASEDGGVHTLSANGSLTLKPGDYVGIRLPKVVGIKKIGTNGDIPGGLTLQYSTNGENWQTGSITNTVPMRYIRLVNQSDSAYTGTIPSIFAEIAVIEMNLSFISTNMTLNQGKWENVIDGKRETLAWTKTRQEKGQYVIYDLGAKQPIHDITLWFPESGDYPHYLDISIGDTQDPNGSWTSVKQFDNQPDMNPPYRYYTCNAGGKPARYIKLEIYQTDNGWIKFNELEINKTISQEDPIGAFSGNPQGEFEKMTDGNITTLFIPGEVGSEGGYLQYLISENTSPAAITILQSPSNISDAPVEVQTKDGKWVALGTLNQGVCTYDTSKLGALQALRVNWKPGNRPAIAEILLLDGSGGNTPSAPSPLLYPNIYEPVADSLPTEISVNYGIDLSLVGLPDQAEVTLNNGHNITLPLTWRCVSYAPSTANLSRSNPSAADQQQFDPTQPGQYRFVGTYQLGHTIITNPGLFAPEITVTVRPQASTPLPPKEENLALKKPVYVSGVETAAMTGPELAVDGIHGDNDSRWSSNLIKNVTPSRHAWIVVDLGEDVQSITAISSEYFNRVWPRDYIVQVAPGSIPQPTDYSKSNISSITDESAFTGDNAIDAAGWTTIYEHSAPSTDHPKHDVPADSIAKIPAGTRYIRLYFKGMNPAAAGHSVGLEELTVTGTRKAEQVVVNHNVQAVAAVNARGSIGSDFGSLGLVSHVLATLEDGTTVRLPVTWDSASYHPNAETQQLTGTLQVSSPITNNNNVQAVLNLTLGNPPQAESVLVNPNSITVAYGTAAEALPLPQQAIVQMDNGMADVYNVRWDTTTYLPEQVGDQSVYGSIAHISMPAIMNVTVKDRSETVTVRFESNGSTAVPTQVIKRGETVSEPFTPLRPGYNFIGWFTDKELTRVWDFSQPVNHDMILYAKWVESSSGGDDSDNGSGDGDSNNGNNSGGSLPFGDIAAGAWYADGVAYVYSKNLMTGTSPTNFSPLATTSRSMVVTILWRLEGKPSSTAGISFADVPAGTWYTDAVRWATADGCITGLTASTFAPHGVITREQLATILYRYAKDRDYDMTSGGNLSGFIDGSKTSSWAADAMKWAVSSGLLSGKGNHTLDPRGTATRAEVATILMRFENLKTAQ